MDNFFLYISRSCSYYSVLLGSTNWGQYVSVEFVEQVMENMHTISKVQNKAYLQNRIHKIEV